MDFPFDDSYSDLHSRFRLSMGVDIWSSLSAFFEYDLEWHTGDFAGSIPFLFTLQMEPEQYLNLERVISDGEGFYAKHSLNRAYLKLSLPGADITAGRHAIDWGRGMAWNPTDPFYPINPLLPEKKERKGADAVGAEIFLDGFSSVSAVVAGKGKRGETVKALRYRTGVGETDFAVTAFYDREFSAGADMSRTFFNTEFYAALRLSEGFDSEFTAGVFRAFPSTFKIAFEYYRNSEGDIEKEDYDWLAWLEGRRQFLARDYVFGWMEYELTSLLRCQIYSMANLNDGGIFFNPVLKYSITANTELEAGYIYFHSDDGDEFSFYPEVAYLRFQWFF